MFLAVKICVLLNYSQRSYYLSIQREQAANFLKSPRYSLVINHVPVLKKLPYIKHLFKSKRLQDLCG